MVAIANVDPKGNSLKYLHNCSVADETLNVVAENCSMPYQPGG